MISAHRGVVVLCDANVLYKSFLRDLVMRLGLSGALRPRWTERIHEEWTRNLLARRPEASPAAIARTRDAMNRALPEALVTVATPGNHNLPDPGDEHVLDAAISAGASLLLTFNLSDFPVSALPVSLKAVHPDEFLRACLEQQPQAVLSALRALRADLKKPPFSPDELLAAMLRADLPGFAERLRPFKDNI